MSQNRNDTTSGQRGPKLTVREIPKEQAIGFIRRYHYSKIMPRLNKHYPEIENIFENSDFLVLLAQAQGDRQIIAKQLGISPHQLSYVTHTNSGEGLLFFGNVTIPFVDHFPQNTELYAIMTTRPEDKKNEPKQE